MKFAKLLQEEVVPEWRKAYLNYKQGKKYLKAIEIAIAAQERAAQERLESGNNGGQSSSLRLIIDPRHPVDSTGRPTTSVPENGGSDHQEEVILDSPTGSTPILSQNRGRVRSYDSIRTLPTTSGPANDDHLSERSVNTLPGTRDVVPQQEQEHQQEGPGQVQTEPPSRQGSVVQQGGNDGQSHTTQVLGKLKRRVTKAKIPELRSKRSRVIHVEGDSIDSVMDQLLDEEKAFFKFLDSQLAMIDAFYKEKELEAETKLRILKQQLYVADEWKRRHDERMARRDGEGWYQTEWSKVRRGFGTLIGSSPSTEDVTLGPAHPITSQYCQGSGAFSTAIPAVSTGGEGAPSDQVIRQRENRPATNGQQTDPSSNDPNKWHSHVIVEDEESRRQHLNHKVARARIKAALYEFYRSLAMIKNYKILNNTGFVKIMKKYDKTAGWKASKLFVSSKLNPTYFMSSTILDDLFKETEDLFIEKFEGGRRRRGMAKLRIPDSRRQSHHSVSARVGLYLGLAVPLLILGLQGAFSQDTQTRIPNWSGLLLVYAGLFLTTLFACLFGVNMYAWSRARINYKFIFEFDPRDNLDYHEFFELPTLFMLILCIAVYLDFGTHATVPLAYYYPLILMSVVLLILFCPLPIASGSARKWFLLSIGRLLISGYYSVEFRDFFLADEMNSLSYSIEQFEFAICAYAHQWNNLAQECSTGQMWLTPFVTALPAWFRFCQCLRRFRDTQQWFPHLVNCGKYTASIVQIFIYFSYRHYAGYRLKAAYIVISIITSIYTFSWDVYMDWGLFRFGKHGGGAYGHPFLRPELVYSWEWAYYVAIVLDFLARFSWILRVAPLDVHPLALSFSLALLEVLRRWMWNFFRLENEHLNNCGQFRAIKDIPLPFHIHLETDSESDHEDDMEQRDYERHNQTDGLEDDLEVIAEGSGSSPKASRPHLKRRSRTTMGLPANDTLGSEQADRASLHSGAASLRPAGLRKRPSETVDGLQQSGAFVDNAMAEAGYGEDQREFLASVNKFFDRRDFDSRIEEADGLFGMKRSGSGGSSGRATHADAPAGGTGPSGPGRGKNKKGGLFGWHSVSDDDDTDDDDDA